MHYPGFPDNRLIVGGVDLTEKFKLVLVDGYVLEPPEPKTYTVNIPGGNGILDLTEYVGGDVFYNNRHQSFDMYVIAPSKFETVKTNVSNFLHGKSFDYKITMDPSYTYHGRFRVTGYEHQMYDLGVVGIIKIDIDAAPYKYKDPVIINANSVTGIEVILNSGRKPVCPTIEVGNETVIIFEGKTYRLYGGTWKLNDITLKQGSNNMYINSYIVRNITWVDLKNNGVSWKKLKTKKIYEWYKQTGSAQIPIKTWDDVANLTWDVPIANEETWDDQLFDTDVKYLKPTYIKYEWGDL